MANNTTMTYGDYSFSPVPFVTLSKQYQTASDGTHLGTVYAITLTGTLTPLPDNEGGIVNVDTLQDELRTAFNQEGQLFKVACGGTTLIAAFPRILSMELSPTNNNWVFTTEFTIQLEWDADDNAEDTFSEYITSANEDWLIEFPEDVQHYSWDLDGTPDANPYILRVTHNISATGKRHYITDGSPTGGELDKPAWEEAKDWVSARVGFDATKLSGHGIININASDFAAYNHMRTKQINELSGEFSVSESWTVINPSGSGVAGRAIEDFNIVVNTSIDNGQTVISMDGNIRGLESRDYGSVSGGFNITEDKYTAAKDYWTTVQGRLYARASKAASNTGLSLNIHTVPRSYNVTHSPTQGSISYAYEYNDRSCNYITGAGVKYENITINDVHPTDVFAEIAVLGRAYGPVLQDMSTVTSSKRNVSIELVMSPPTGCSKCTSIASMMTTPPTGEIAELLCCFEAELTDADYQVFKSQDTSNWNPKSGQYSRNVEWTYTRCTGDAPSTSFC